MRINYDRLVYYIYHYHVGIILLSLVLSVFGGYFVSKLRISTDNADLLPQDYISVRELNRIKERVGGIGPLMVIITGKDLDRTVEFLHVLADSLEQNPLISSVSRGKNPKFQKKNRLLFMDLEDLEEIHDRLDEHIEYEKYKRSPMYIAFDDEEESELDFSDIEAKYHNPGASNELEANYYVTPQGNGVVLRVYPQGVVSDMKFNDRLIRSVNSTIETIDPKRFHPSIECFNSGAFKNFRDQYSVISNDLQSTALYAFLGVLLLISLYFRQILAPLIIIVPLMMSISWTFGLTYLTIGNLNQITVSLFAVLFGLGIDIGIHIFARYREARRRGMDVEQALTETVCHTGSALSTTALTTSLAFFALLFTDYKGFSQFGFISGVGILFSLIAMLVTCPAFIILAERVGLMRLHLTDVPSHLLSRGRYPVPAITIVLGVVATGYALWTIPAMQEDGFEYDFKQLKPKVKEAKTKASLPPRLKETRSPAIVLTENREEALSVVAAVKRNKAAKDTASTVKSVKSVYSALPSDQSEKIVLVTRIRELLDANLTLFEADQRAKVDSLRPSLEPQELTLKDLPSDETNKFTSKDGEILSFVIINASVPLRDGKNAMRFADEVSVIETTEETTYYASSAHIIFAEMLRLMLRDSTPAVIMTFLVVVIVLFIDLRRVMDTLLVLTPLLTALTWVVGFMYLFDIKVNVYNMVAFPTIIGMGIDNGVHIFHRYREAGPGSMRLVLRTTGMALVATSLTTMVGFAGLVPANHPALSSIGIVSLIGLGCCFVTSVSILPALLQLRESRLQKKA